MNLEIIPIDTQLMPQLQVDSDKYTPHTKEDLLLESCGHANRYAKELSQLYMSLLFEAVRKTDIATSAKFCSLLSELCLVTSLSKSRAEQMAGRKYE